MLTEKKIKLKDIAKIVGVSSAAVSGVLNNSLKINCGQAKREQILKLAQEHNYTPNNNARALATGRTKQIGFLVSETATSGLGNAYYATLLAGVEKIARNYNYLTTVSACNLNDINKFVFPNKFREQSVDGLIVAGPVLPEIINVICSTGVPTIICCDPHKSNAEDTMHIGKNQIFLSFNKEINNLRAIESLARLGHRKICLSLLWTKLSLTVPEGVQLIYEPLKESDTYQQGVNLGKKWLKSSKGERFTALLGVDQFCYGFLRTLNSVDASLCPNEVSVLCLADMKMNEMFYPSVSALSCTPFEYGSISSRLLIDLIDKQRPFEILIKEAKEFYYRKYELIIRESLGKAPDNR